MIHYYRHTNGFLAIDTSQRFRQAPNLLYGKAANRPGDLGSIAEGIWTPENLGKEVSADEVPIAWIKAFGFEPPKAKRKIEEAPNSLPGLSYLVPLMPLDEYEAWLNRGCEEESEKTSDLWLIPVCLAILFAIGL